MAALPHSDDDPQLRAALAGSVSLRIGDLLGIGWQSLAGSKRWLLLGMSIWLAVAVTATTLGVLLRLPEALAASLSVIATAPVSLALTMYAVRRVAGVPTDLAALQRYRPAIPHAVLVLMLASLVITASDALFGPGFGAGVSLLYGLLTGQALFLVADRGVDAFTAIGWSVRASLPVLFTLVLVQLALALALALGALALGIGLIWAAPFAMLTLGAVSFRLFGTRAAPQAG